MKKIIIKRKQDKRNKNTFKPKEKIKNKEPENKLLKTLRKELDSIKRKWERLETSVRNGDPKAIKGIGLKRKKFKSQIDDKTQQVINRMKDLGDERSAEKLLENVILL